MAFSIADNLLEIAHTAVVGCIPETSCDLPVLVGYVAVGTRVRDPLSDYVVVSLSSLAPTRRSSDASGRMRLPIYRATFQIRLLESGWPVPWGDDEIIVPSADEYMQAAKHSYSHAEAMYRALHIALTTNELTGGCTDCFASIGALEPVEPSGGSVGWETTVVTEFDMSKSQL